MILVDSCGWIAWLTDDARAEVYAAVLRPGPELLVPTIVLYEVTRWVQRERGETAALEIAAHMKQCEIRDLDSATALLAADIGLQHRLATADALVYAHARLADAALWTSDAHFRGLAGVRLVE